MKLTNKPVIKGKFIRFCFIHCGSYSENHIAKNGGKLQLPSEENLYSISKTVLGLEIGNLIYIIAVAVVEGIYIVQGQNNATLRYTAFILFCVYSLVTIFSTVFCMVKTSKVEKLQWESKYNALIETGIKNEMSFSQAEEYLWDEKTLRFHLYDLDMAIALEKQSSKIQILDVTHNRYLTLGENLQQLNSITVNGKSLSALWCYLDISVEEI